MATMLSGCAFPNAVTIPLLFFHQQKISNVLFTIGASTSKFSLFSYFIRVSKTKMKGGDNMGAGAATGAGGAGFALIVVLFVLLIIVGASYVGGAGGADPVFVGVGFGFFPFFPFFPFFL